MLMLDGRATSPRNRCRSATDGRGISHCYYPLKAFANYTMPNAECTFDHSPTDMHALHLLDDSLGRIKTHAAPRADTGGPHCSAPTHEKAGAPPTRVLAEHPGQASENQRSEMHKLVYLNSSRLTCMNFSSWTIP